MEEAARCLLCHDAPCSQGCPAGTDPAKFIRSIRFRMLRERLKPSEKTIFSEEAAPESVLMTDCVKKPAADAV